MKKTLILLLTFTLLLGCLAACGSKAPAATPTPEPTQEPTPSPTPEPVDLQAFFDGLSDKYELAAMSPLDEEARDAFYPGLNEIETKQLVAYAPMMSAVVSEFVLVECANAEDVAKVEEILSQRISSQAEGGAFYPASEEAWSQAQVVSNGNMVAMIATFDLTEDIVKDFNHLF